MGKSLGQLEPLTVGKLRDHIEDKVREAILNGTFRPGQRVVETMIAEQLHVSRAPVREVLSALERDGLIVNIARRGSFVVDFTDKDIEEIYSLRLLLEIGALRRATGCFTDADLAEMQSVVDKLGVLTREHVHSPEVVSLDLTFHAAICRAADHGRLFSVWNSMQWQTLMLIGLTSKTYQANPEQPRQAHQAILDAIRARDLNQAEFLLTQHITDAQQRAAAALREQRLSPIEAVR